MPDLSEFKRANYYAGTAEHMAVLGMIGAGYDGNTDPSSVPLEVIYAMGWNPIVYLGEQALSSAVRDPEIYYVRHADKLTVAATEAWLRPLLPELVAVIARSVAYGSIPYVLDWVVSDLAVTIRGEGTAASGSMPGFVHYGAVHEIWPGEAKLLVENDDLIAIRTSTGTYGNDRAFVSIWDRQFGQWQGQGSRRRAYPAWFRARVLELWRARWHERSVDPPRIGFAPAGKITLDGREVRATELLTSALMALKNGGATTLPSEVDQKGEKMWSIEVLDLPDRADVWGKALSREDAQMLLASLVPPSTVGVEDASFAGARVPAQLFVEFVEGVAAYVAAEITKIVCVVHRLRHGQDAACPVIVARDLPSVKRKLLLEVFRTVASIPRAVEGGKEVTLAELVSDEIIDDLGLPKRTIKESARDRRDTPAAPIKPTTDATSEREARREAARTEEGEGATGSHRDASEMSSVKRAIRRLGRMFTSSRDLAKVEPQPINVTTDLKLSELPAPIVNVTVQPSEVVVQPMPAPVVNVEPAIVNVPAPIVNVAAPAVNVPAPVVNVAAAEIPAPVVNVPAPIVNVTVEQPANERTVKFSRDKQGRIQSASVEAEGS